MEEKEKMIFVPLNKISMSSTQPREEFKEISDLAESIKKHGLLEPLKVEKRSNKYVLIDGERRFRALKLLNKKTAECIMLNTKNDKHTLALQLVFDLQKKNFKPIERAKAVKSLVDGGWKINSIANKLSVNSKTVSNYLELLSFDKETLDLVKENKISSTTLLKKLPKYKRQQGVEKELVRKLKKSKKNSFSSTDIEDYISEVKPVKISIAEFRIALVDFRSKLVSFLKLKMPDVPKYNDIASIAGMSWIEVNKAQYAWGRILESVQENLALLEKVKKGLEDAKKKACT